MPTSSKPIITMPDFFYSALFADVRPRDRYDLLTKSINRDVNALVAFERSVHDEMQILGKLSDAIELKAVCLTNADTFLLEPAYRGEFSITKDGECYFVDERIFALIVNIETYKKLGVKYTSFEGLSKMFHLHSSTIKAKVIGLCDHLIDEYENDFYNMFRAYEAKNIKDFVLAITK